MLPLTHYRQFLMSNGVSSGQAATVAGRVLRKAARKESLTEPEALLSTVFLNSGGANLIGRQQLEHCIWDWHKQQELVPLPSGSASRLPSGKRQHKPVTVVSPGNVRGLSLTIDGQSVNPNTPRYGVLIRKLSQAVERGQASSGVRFNPSNYTLSKSNYWNP